MKKILLIACAAGTLLHFATAWSSAENGPFEAGEFKGRIAYSADGNHNDEDDWAASPVALAIFAECGVKDRLVHFDYNCILTATNPEWEKTHAASVLGAAERYGFDKSVFVDCRKDLEGAIAAITRAVNGSSADDRLYFIIAGPVEVPYLGIQKSNPEKRRFVYCISHSRWNDGFDRRYTFTHTKRRVIELGVNWVQIRDQNPLLSTSPYGRPARTEEWRPWEWMKASEDSKVRFLWERMQTTGRADPSDAGMAYFLVTGDEECDPQKLKRLLDDNGVPSPIRTRVQIRLEAENFRDLTNYELEQRNDSQISHRINVKLASGATGRIRTRFVEPHTAARGRYDVDVRYSDEQGQRCRFALFVNGLATGLAWESTGNGQGWATETIRDVEIRAGDEITVDAQGSAGRLDYVQLNDRAPLSAPAVGRSSRLSEPR